MDDEEWDTIYNLGIATYDESGEEVAIGLGIFRNTEGDDHFIIYDDNDVLLDVPMLYAGGAAALLLLIFILKGML